MFLTSLYPTYYYHAELNQHNTFNETTSRLLCCTSIVMTTMTAQSRASGRHGNCPAQTKSSRVIQLQIRELAGDWGHDLEGVSEYTAPLPKGDSKSPLPGYGGKSSETRAGMRIRRWAVSEDKPRPIWRQWRYTKAANWCEWEAKVKTHNEIKFRSQTASKWKCNPSPAKLLMQNRNQAPGWPHNQPLWKPNCFLRSWGFIFGGPEKNEKRVAWTFPKAVYKRPHQIKQRRSQRTATTSSLVAITAFSLLGHSQMRRSPCYRWSSFGADHCYGDE